MVPLIGPKHIIGPFISLRPNSEETLKKIFFSFRRKNKTLIRFLCRRDMTSMEEVAREEVEIDKDLQRKIEKTVKKILESSNLYKITEIKAREEASLELDLDLSQDPYKGLRVFFYQ
ncbi:DEK C-terminal [Arabidopsis suecica]|uniref:DEK C-terminal n=1 Tax=Arabidopsis suecica TaxID=45249 RepID=A0A8T1YRH7_ARASU|nr:DEK C-terminal [Arabidopsis suecica]